MKRSITIKMAVLGVGALTLGACEEAKEDVLTYDSVKSCTAAGVMLVSAWRAAWYPSVARYRSSA